MLRAFVALEISSPIVLDALQSFESELGGTCASLKVVERGNIHFTVKFLGEISEAQTAEADSRLKGLVLPAAEVEVRGAGAFPSVGNPSVVWVGVAPQDKEKVLSIAGPTIAALEGIGERNSRPFHPHATLARLRSRRREPELTNLLNDSRELSFGRTHLNLLKLKKSVLTPASPKYSDIGAYHLT